jgi:hypothetical protein
LSAPVRCHLLGARGAVGEVLAAALGAAPGIELRGYSGAPGAASYAAFLEGWTPDPSAVVVLAGGTSSGPVAALVEQHVARVARCLDRFGAVGWPGRVLLVGSAAELLSSSAYGALKGAQRRLLEAAAAAARVPAVCLRLHSMVPLTRPTRGLFAELLTQYEARGPVSVHHLGGARDYVSAAQLALACATVVSHPEAWDGPEPRVVDVGNGLPVTVSDWLDAFRAELGPEVAFTERAPDTRDPHVVADPGPLRELLARCDPAAVARYEAARPDLRGFVRGWRASGS